MKMADAAAAQSGRGYKLAATVAVTSVVMLGYIGVSLRSVDYPQDITLPPVVATATVPSSTTMSAPAPEMVASVPAGLPIWTAALFAEQAPIHFASIDLTALSR